MTPEEIRAAATTIWKNWSGATRIVELPPFCRPTNRAEGYDIQSALAELTGQPVAGWKIAATSLAGQKHIGVDGPLAGRLFSDRVLTNGAQISLAGNHMRVAEAEFTFRFGRDLPKRDEPYAVGEVLDAVASLHPAVEIPDSRYLDFAHVGAAQLIADDACACWFVLGEAVMVDWRGRNLAEHPVTGYLNDGRKVEGVGANVLGDPRVALTWIANELSRYGDGLRAGEFVTTGTCIAPPPIAAGDQFCADFGAFGEVSVSFS